MIGALIKGALVKLAAKQLIGWLLDWLVSRFVKPVPDSEIWEDGEPKPAARKPRIKVKTARRSPPPPPQSLV